jgi:LmbE family N-acetylglucosaminyl deacetylase
MRLTFKQPEELLPGSVLILAPHMDDEVLACGGTIAAIADRRRVWVAFATDGARSPHPPAPWFGRPSGELPAIRSREAIEALGVLGILQDSVHFLGLPDGRLAKRREELAEAVARLVEELRPDHLLVPFRYDRHPDHLALNRVATAAVDSRERPRLLEYFVYYRWRLLPGGDVRRYVRPDRLVAVDVSPHADRKRRALASYESQTTRFFEWQHRPILTEALIDEVCEGPEVFMIAQPGLAGAEVFNRARLWIRLAHRLEPAIKSGKDRLAAILGRRWRR